MAKHNVPGAELKVGEHVRISGEGLEGRVVGHYAHESLDRIATLYEASNHIYH